MRASALTLLLVSQLLFHPVGTWPSSSRYAPNGVQAASPRREPIDDANLLPPSQRATTATTTVPVGDPSYQPPAPDPNRALDELPDARPPVEQRRFRSQLVEDEIRRISDKIRDPALRRIWENCYPNSLDTTVAWVDLDESQPDLTKAFPRAFIITGDIEASWIRDSTSQLNPYLPLLARNQTATTTGAQQDEEWDKLYRLALGLVYQQSQFVLTHPFANSFGPPNSANITKRRNSALDPSNDSRDYVFPPPPGVSDGGFPPRPPPASYNSSLDNDGVFAYETKWEVDSLANFLRLPHQLASHAGRADFLHSATWRRAARLGIDALRSQQRGADEEYAAMSRSGSEPRPDPPTPPAAKPPQARSVDGATYDDPLNATLPTERFPEGVVVNDANLAAARAADEGEGEWARRFADFGGGVYRFQRLFRSSTETRSLGGVGEPARRTGMVKSAFRPSDDATVLPFFVPGNAMLAVSLERLADTIAQYAPRVASPGVGANSLASIADDARGLAAEIRDAIGAHAVMRRGGATDDAGDVFAYEVDGYGGGYFMDDANIPSLLSLPYLGYLSASDATYRRTRAQLLSSRTNKFFFQGRFGSGIGGPHVGWRYAWPMSRMVQILTADDATDAAAAREERRDALRFLRSTTTGTGLMHESVNVDDLSSFTRPWFGWANGLFGEAIRHIEAGPSASLLAETF